MVEKPLAVNLNHAKKIEKAASESGIQVVTNYETTWHASLDSCSQFVGNNGIGELKKVVFHHGNFGTRHTKAPPEFIEWLTDSVKMEVVL